MGSKTTTLDKISTSNSWLRRWLTTPVGINSRQVRWWFVITLAATLIYAIVGTEQAFDSPYVIHDDVRSHVFWMRRYLDPDLFPGDLIADYFQSVAPWGYAWLYRGAAAAGIDPLWFNKFVPLGIVMATASYCFWLCWEILPVPFTGFVATVFLNQNIWVTHDVASGTPRAFLYPLFIAFLYYLLRGSLIPCLVAIALQGLFYPQCLFLSGVILCLRILRLKGWRLNLSSQPQDYLFAITGIGVVGLMLLPYALKISDFGPVTTVEQAQQLPILQQSGRKVFFYDSFWKFWICGERCGVVPYDWCKYFPPPQAIVGLALPGLLWQSKRFPLVKKLNQVSILHQILLSSLIMFFAAHALLFRLHLPSRYTKHSLRILVAVAGAITLTIILDSLWQWLSGRSWLKPLRVTGVAIVYIALIFSYPVWLEEYPNPDYVTAKNPEIQAFFSQQPPDILIASLSKVADNIPAIAQRSTLATSETANPYHWGYYQEIQRRSYSLMEAQYSSSLEPAKQLINQYGVDFFLIDREAFTPEYIEKNSWLRNLQPYAAGAIDKLNQKQYPALAQIMDSCKVFEADNRVILSAQCILDYPLN